MLLGGSYSSLPLLVKASHAKVFENCSPETLGGCAGLGRSAFILTDSFVSYPPRPSTLGGCCGPERPVTVSAFVLKGLPPPLPRPLPGLLGVDFCLAFPPPPHPLPLFGLLLLKRLCQFCGLPGEGERLVELFLLPELLHC